MLIRAKLFRDTDYTIHFSDGIDRPYASFLSACGTQALFHLELRFADEVLVLNDRIDNRWGREERMPTRQAEVTSQPSVTLRFADGALQVTNDVGTRRFERFGLAELERTHYVRHFGTSDTGGQMALLAAGPEVVRARIENRILSHRLERLERLAAGGAGS